MRLFTFLLLMLISGRIFAEAPAQPQILWTMEFNPTRPDYTVPDYRPDDPKSYYDTANPFLPKGEATDLFGMQYGDENVFLGEGGVTAKELRATMDVMGGSFTSSNLYSSEGNAFINATREASEEAPDTQMGEYFNTLEVFLGGQISTLPNAQTER